MKKNLVFIGNSGAARECYWLAREIIGHGEPLLIKGFLSFEGHPPNLRDLSDLLLGNDDNYQLADNDVLAIGIGNPALRRKAFLKWKKRGGRFANLVHPAATLVHDVAMGEGNIICSGSYLSCNTSIGDANYLNGTVVIGHDARIGDFNFFGPFSMILGSATVGSGNTVGVRTTIMEAATVGDDNILAPGACLYKGCGNRRVMTGNPAYSLGAKEDMCEQ